ncbi:DUF6522 family protein [Methylobacterium nigriterrae]|uniref:DUF6522 family protein n=1 Tax=Methylobacterium nigriterrae TaxID=3127512 RepID=UPI00301363B5
MHFARDSHGKWIVDPELFASRLGINPAHIQRDILLGLVTSSVQAGDGSGEGFWRVKIQCRKVIWNGVIDDGGALISESCH